MRLWMWIAAGFGTLAALTGAYFGVIVWWFLNSDPDLGPYD